MEGRRCGRRAGDSALATQATNAQAHHAAPPLGQAQDGQVAAHRRVREVVSDALRRLTDGRANDDFVFVTQARSTCTALRWAGGLPWYQSDFYEGRWVPALAAAHAAGLPKAPRFHDLRHTYVAWAVASGASGGVVSGWLDGRENAFSTPGHRALHGHVSAMAPVLGRPSRVRRRQW